MSEHLPTPEPLEPVDVRFLPESELIEITTDIDRALTPLGEAAFDEYMRRRGEVINRAIAQRAIEALQSEVQAKFAHLSDASLMARMNRAPDFGTDDEEIELTRRTAVNGMAWRWSEDYFHPRVEIYKPEVVDE